jgi:sulfatase modifying factor 1
VAPEWLYTAYGRDEDAEKYAALAEELAAQGDLHAAASAYDRAFGLHPEDSRITTARRDLLEQLSCVEQGILFRYIPAGTFLMGSETGDPDETPAHPVQLDAFWMAETPLSWAKQCELMGWEPPTSPAFHQQRPEAFKDKEGEKRFWWRIQGDKERLQYCENETLRARDWHAHQPEMLWNAGTERQKTSRDIFGEVPRASRTALGLRPETRDRGGLERSRRTWQACFGLVRYL